LPVGAGTSDEATVEAPLTICGRAVTKDDPKAMDSKIEGFRIVKWVQLRAMKIREETQRTNEIDNEIDANENWKLS
jgi:hypothetical protein